MAEELCFSASLLLDGAAPSAAQLAAFLPLGRRQELCWVAANGGSRLACDYMVQLQAIVGDFDSTPPEHLFFLDGAQAHNFPSANLRQKPVEQLRFGREKDESDRNLALEYLLGQGHRHIVQIGGGGGRSDHFLAMIYDYQLRRLPIYPKLWLTGSEAIFYLQAGEQLELTWPQPFDSINYLGSTPEPVLFSIFPLSAESCLYSENLKWPLATLCQNINLWPKIPSELGRAKRLLPYSLSNWAVARPAVIGVTRGSALIFCPYPPAFNGQSPDDENANGEAARDDSCVFKLYSLPTNK